MLELSDMYEPNGAMKPNTYPMQVALIFITTTYQQKEEYQNDYRSI